MKRLLMLFLIGSTLPAHACGGLLRDIIDPDCRPPPASPMAWSKAKATQIEFAQTRYRCLQESQQRLGNALVINGNGAATNSMVANSQLFTACMNASGWTLLPRQ